LLAVFIATHSLCAQVPAKGLVTDKEGNIYVALHAPGQLSFDGFPLPISKLRTNYLIKLDSNGDLIDITHVEGAADMAGPLQIKDDTLFFAQGHFYANDGGDAVNKGEIVLTKISTALDRIFTVTIPLPVFGRPLAVDYENNYWYVAYGFLGQNSPREGNSPNLALAGIRHNYSDGWIKQLSARTISDLWLENEKLWCLGTYAYNLRWGNQKATTEGIDFFVGEVDKSSGNALSIQQGNTGQVLHAARFFGNNNKMIGGSVLLQGDEQNLEQLFFGSVSADNSIELITKAENRNNSRIVDYEVLDDYGIVALANFNGTLTLGGIELKSGGQQDVCLIRFDKKGRVIWIEKIGTALNDEGLALSKTTDGAFIVAYQKRDKGFADVLSSFFASMPTSGEVELVKFNGDGNVLWKRSIEATSPE
jgi:hypothetical protein